ncbi:PspC domain-containing protein [Planotetraspora sp. GP83]|uniref:PspC domain-containing protein n=1 Tax=Planotetraspora sp. GP83 TaxID=3156264 RepID=UPI003517EE2B
MTEAPPTTADNAAGAAPGGEPERVLSRSRSGRMLTGVCAGLGRYTGMDPVLFRVGFAVLVLASGIGIMLYVAAFLLMREPGGGPGYLEQWTRRMFDAETVLALMAAVFAFGLIINVASGGISRGTIVVGTLLAIVLLAAHARGVDLLMMAKSVPERATGRRGMTRTPATAAFTSPPPQAPFTMTDPRSTTPDPAVPSQPASTAGTREMPSGAAGTDDAAGSGGAGGAAAPEDVAADRGASGATARTTAGTTAMPVGPPATAGYRRLSDLAREARDSTYGYSSGEPFAPHGPYTAREPYRHQESYQPSPPPAPPRPPQPRKAKRPRSFIGGLTICLALIVGGVMVTVQRSGAGAVSLPVIGGAVLVTIGAGLLVATWFGRGAALVAAGTIVSLVLVAGSSVNGIPKKIGSFVWRPVSSAQANKDYVLGMGEGRLDLSDYALAPGSRVTFNASVSVGQITVIVPSTARVEVHGYTKLGEVKIDHKVEDGADVSFDRVLEPEVTGPGDVPTIELHVKAGIGDVEVRRAA